MGKVPEERAWCLTPDDKARRLAKCADTRRLNREAKAARRLQYRLECHHRPAPAALRRERA